VPAPCRACWRKGLHAACLHHACMLRTCTTLSHLLPYQTASALPLRSSVCSYMLTRCRASVQGIETVRRDNCLMVRKMVTVVLDKLLKERDPDGAVAHVKALIADLLLNKVDMSDLVVSKSLSQARRPRRLHPAARTYAYETHLCMHCLCRMFVCATLQWHLHFVSHEPARELASSCGAACRTRTHTRRPRRTSSSRRR
jgi:DNA polymerase family B